MKWSFVVLAAVVGFLGLLAWLPSVDATTTCQGGSGPAVANTCQGYAHVSTATGGVGGARCFAFRTTNTAPTCTTSGITPTNEAWQMNAGACITLYYFDTSTGVAPGAPNKVSLLVLIDDSGTGVKTFQTLAAEPSNGASFTFCATTNGNSGSPARAGTYSPRMRVVDDDNAGNVGEYDIDTEGTALVGAIINYDRGALRGNQFVSSVSRSAYPSGSTFAYGASGDESATITGSFTEPNGDISNRETMRTFILDSGTLLIGSTGATVDVDSGSLAQAFVIDNTFPFANNPWVPGVNIVGNAGLTGLKWTTFAATGHGTNIVRDSDTQVHDSTTFNIDSRIVLDKLGTNTYAGADNMARMRVGSSSGTIVTLFNKGEGAYWETYLLNARSQQLTRAMTFTIRDSALTTCHSLGSITPTSGKYSGTFTTNTGAVCLTANDANGLPRTFLVTNTDQSQTSAASYSVSSLYYVDYHAQKTSTLVQDDFPNQDAAETVTYVISADTMHIWCHVKGVRLDVNIDTGVNDVTVKETETDDTTVIDSMLIGTGSDGWTTAADLVSPVPPARTIHGHCLVSFNGNTGSTIQSIGWASAFTGNLNCRPSIVPIPEVGVTSRIFLAVNQDGANLTPDEVPHIRIDYGDNSSIPPAWVNILPHQLMFNVNDNTTTVDGSLYFLDWTPTIDGLVNLESHCIINGASLYQDKLITVKEQGLLELHAMNNFEGLGFDGFLFVLFWIAAALFFIYRDWAFSLAFTIPGLLDALFPSDIPGEFAQYLLLAFLGVVMQYFAGSRQRFSLHGKKSGA